MATRVPNAEGTRDEENAVSHSEAIDSAVAAAQAEGNSVVEVSNGWEKAKEVVHMKAPLTEVLHFRLVGDARLRYWTDPATPHNKATEGFIDEVEKVAIEFPARPHGLRRGC